MVFTEGREEEDVLGWRWERDPNPEERVLLQRAGVQEEKWVHKSI